MFSKIYGLLLSPSNNELRGKSPKENAKSPTPNAEVIFTPRTKLLKFLNLIEMNWKNIGIDRFEFTRNIYNFINKIEKAYKSLSEGDA